MPKSKKRGGEKDHNKRIQKRKQELLAAKKKMQKMYSEMLQKRFEELQKQNATEVDSEKNLVVELNGNQMPVEVLNQDVVLEGSTENEESVLVDETEK
jgi:hypothetical protein